MVTLGLTLYVVSTAMADLVAAVPAARAQLRNSWLQIGLGWRDNSTFRRQVLRPVADIPDDCQGDPALRPRQFPAGADAHRDAVHSAWSAGAGPAAAARRRHTFAAVVGHFSLRAALLAIHHRMRALRDGRTSVLISHRLSTVRDASLIDSSPGTTMCSQVPGP